MLNATVLPDGALLLTADNWARSELAAMRRAGRCYWSIMADAFESYSCNGSFAHFDAGEGNPFVGLTSAPCIAEQIDYSDDSGALGVIGRVWHLADYATRDDLAELIRKGRAVYQFGFDAGEGGAA